MTKTITNQIYKAFGLIIQSQIPLPELARAGDKEGVNVTVEKADLSKTWNELVPLGKKNVIKKDLYMFKIPNVATFCVQSGKKIIVSPVEHSDEEQTRLFILGTSMGALLMQRKLLPLHGSVIAIDGKAYAFVGESGAGKSSLAAAFLNKGYKLLSDDVIPVSLARDGIPYVIPSYPQQKLWQESMNEFGLEANHYRPIFKRENKYAVPVPTMFYNEPLPLACVFEITKMDNEHVEIHRIEGFQRLHTLSRHTYRNSLIKDFGLMEWHFATSIGILNKIDVCQLQRPAYGFTAYQLAASVLTTLNKGAL